MRILNSALKTFGELEKGNYIFYIDPSKPTEIQELLIKDIQPIEKPGYIKVIYYKSSAALSLITSENHDLIPTGIIITQKNNTRILTLTIPLSIYFTNKEALIKFMGNVK